MKKGEIENYLVKLGEAYEALKGPTLEIGVCGGAALMVTGLVDRTTRDIDILFPSRLPPLFWEACQIVAEEFGLPNNWINLGPKELSEIGLPPEFKKRAIRKPYGKNIEVFFASRLDQIFFKVYASADRGGYHVDDLLKLKPTNDELEKAALWCMTHDVSEGFRQILISMFKQLGFDHVAKKL